MTLLNKRLAYKPFKYDWAYEAFLTQNRIHWMAEEVPMAEDVRDWNYRLTEEEKSFLTQIFRFFTQGDISVANGYIHHFMPKFSGNPEVAMMLTSFAATESIHVNAYATLIDTIGMPEVEYTKFLEYSEMLDKHEYVEKFKMSTPRDIAKSLAVYSAFTEGLQLFSSFIMLLNFSRYGKMKGMGQIVTWSVRDECYSDDTEVLTEDGWVKFPNLLETQKVAAYSPEGIYFIEPSRIISKDYEGNLIHLSNIKGNIDLLVTPEHDLVYQHYGLEHKETAREFDPHYRRKFITAGNTLHGDSELTPEERVLIALQADGTIPAGKYRNGNQCGYRTVNFSLKKERKINRLLSLLDQSEFEYSFGEDNCKPDMTKIYVKIPVSYPISKNFKDWVKVNEVSSTWSREFIEEIMYWDGSDRYGDQSVIYYGTTVKDNIDIIQALCALCSYTSSYSVQEDNRKESYKDVHRLWIYKTNIRPTGSVNKTEVPYNGRVYCVTVPTGKIIVRRNGCVIVCGNCLHVDNMIKLFRTFIQENIEIWTDEFKKELYDIAREMVKLEFAFIDLAFESGGIKGLDKEEVKEYVKYIADRRLLQLGLKPNFGVKDNPLPWVDEILNLTEHANFFETRATEYSKGSITGDWSKVWA